VGNAHLFLIVFTSNYLAVSTGKVWTVLHVSTATEVSTGAAGATTESVVTVAESVDSAGAHDVINIIDSAVIRK
jgi:hypothetical protein